MDFSLVIRLLVGTMEMRKKNEENGAATVRYEGTIDGEGREA
jgi:hypothetical protein